MYTGIGSIHSDVLPYPIVDAVLGSTRESMLQELLLDCFRAPYNVVRGGTLMGFNGVGKSQMVKNVVFGKQLAGWALGNGTDHIGIYVGNPASPSLDMLQGAVPAAFIAAGLK